MKSNVMLRVFALCVLLLFHWQLSQAQPFASPSGYFPSPLDYYESLPKMHLSSASSLTNLPYQVDNSTSMYFPKYDGTTTNYIYDQEPTAGCQNIATVFYTFTYELNRLRNLTSNTQQSRYAPNFTYNHLNHGYQGWQGYTSLKTVQNFLKEHGAMSDADFNGATEQLDPSDSWRWPTGYSLYSHVFNNKLDSVHTFDMSIPSGQGGQPSVNAKLDSNLTLMKHYIYICKKSI